MDLCMLHLSQKVRAKCFAELNATQKQSSELGLPVCGGDLANPEKADMNKDYVKTTMQEVRKQVENVQQQMGNRIPMMEVTSKLHLLHHKLRIAIEAL
eukprot:88917-Amphidinium_carterae.1